MEEINSNTFDKQTGMRMCNTLRKMIEILNARAHTKDTNKLS